jgi:hypothetical protein
MNWEGPEMNAKMAEAIKVIPKAIPDHCSTAAML